MLLLLLSLLPVQSVLVFDYYRKSKGTSNYTSCSIHKAYLLVLTVKLFHLLVNKQSHEYYDTKHTLDALLTYSSALMWWDIVHQVMSSNFSWFSTLILVTFSTMNWVSLSICSSSFRCFWRDLFFLVFTCVWFMACKNEMEKGKRKRDVKSSDVHEIAINNRLSCQVW